MIRRHKHVTDVSHCLMRGWIQACRMGTGRDGMGKDEKGWEGRNAPNCWS